MNPIFKNEKSFFEFEIGSEDILGLAGNIGQMQTNCIMKKDKFESK